MREDEEFGLSEDEQIAAIFAAAKQLTEELETAIKNKDVTAQRLLTVKLMRVELDFKRIETGKRLLLAMVMKGVRDAKTPEKRRENLLNAFKVTADIRGTAKYGLVDDDLTNAAETQLQTLIGDLDALEPEGRKALIPSLNGFSLDARACAAIALLELMPDRAVAVLRDLVKNEPGTNARLTAQEALEDLNRRR